MKVSFEGASLAEVMKAMDHFLWDVRDTPRVTNQDETMAAPPKAASGNGATLAELPAPPVEDAKKKAMKERLAKARAARGKKKPAAEVQAEGYAKQLKKDLDAAPIENLPEGAKGVIKSSDEGLQLSFEDIQLEQPEPATEPEVLTAQQLAALRIKITAELQSAYASGKHKQVLALLKEYGNGAKSFRELRVDDFPPIRKAIDGGALA